MGRFVVVKSIVNLGSGTLTYPEAVNVDSVELPGVDIIHDLDIFPWPFDDVSQDEVWASQVFEHIADPIAFMREAWRILRPGGLLHMTTPHWQSDNSYTDPTHRRHCTERTWDYWIYGTRLCSQFGQQYAAGCLFDKEDIRLVDCEGGQDLMVYLRRR